MKSSIAKQTLCYGLGIVLMKSISLLMLPYITHHLTPASFAQLDLLVTSANLLSILLSMGLIDALYRFAGQTEHPQHIFQQALQLALALGIFISGIGLLIFHVCTVQWANISAFAWYCLIFSVALEGAIGLPLAWLRMQEQAVSFLILSLSKAAGQALLTVYLLQQDPSADSVILAGLISSCALVLALLWPQRALLLRAWDWALCKTLLMYGFPLMLAGLAGFMQNGAERFFIAQSLSLEELAHYALGAKFALLVSLLLQPYCMWWFAKRFQVSQQQNGLALSAHYAQLGVQLLILISLSMLSLTPIAIHYLTPAPYHAAIPYIPLFISAIVFKHAGDLLNLGCYQQKSTWLALKINIYSALCALLGYAIAIPLLGLYGALLALNSSYALRLR